MESEKAVQNVRICLSEQWLEESGWKATEDKLYIPKTPGKREEFVVTLKSRFFDYFVSLNLGSHKLRLISTKKLQDMRQFFF